MNRIAIVSGISCSGKDFVLDQIKEYLSFPIVNFGEALFQELLKEHPSLTGRDQIEQLPVALVTQSVLTVIERLVVQQPVVISSHTVTRVGKELVVRKTAQDLLKPLVYVHISAPVSEIVERRKRNCRNRHELVETIDQISFHQDLSEWVTKRLAVSTGSSFYRVWNQDGTSVLSELTRSLEVLN